MKLTEAQMEAGWEAWKQVKARLPLFDRAIEAAFLAAAKADVENPGDIAAVRAALEAVDVPERK